MTKPELIQDIKDLIGNGYYGNVSMLLKKMKTRELKAIRKMILELDNVPMLDLSLVLSILIVRIEHHYDIVVSPTLKRKVRLIKRMKR